MKAVLCTRLAPRFEGVAMHERPKPVPGPGEVLVRLRATALNFPDVLMCEGGYQFKPDLPFAPGMESSGDVVELGAGVAVPLLGSRVVAGLRAGGLQEYVAVSAGQLRPAPDGYTYDEAAAYTTAYLTAYVALVRRGGLVAGETLLVHGAAGGVGLAAVDLGLRLGARVIVTASSAEKRAVVQGRGAHHVLEPTGFRDAVKDLTGGAGADVIYDPVGGDVFDESVRAIAWNGRLLVIGFASGRIPTLSANMALIKGFSLVGVRAGEYGRRDPERGRENIAEIDRMAREGLIRPYIGARVPLDHAVEGLRMLSDRRAIGKVVVTL